MFEQNLFHAVGIVIDTGFHPIELDQQHGLGVDRQSGREHARFNRADDRVVHHFQSGRQHPGSDYC